MRETPHARAKHKKVEVEDAEGGAAASDEEGGKDAHADGRRGADGAMSTDVPLAGFDFSVLGDPEFKEDSVREEIVLPIIKALGYRPTGRNRIVRTRALEHPFVAIGSKRKPISIFPDYTLYAEDRIAWVLDAKAPWEPVDEPDHVAQAYSYAIHRDVRVDWFAVCNGREFALFHVADMSSDPRLRGRVSELDRCWEELKRLLLPPAIASSGKPFAKDFGIHLMKLGVTPEVECVFPSIPIARLGRLFDDLYSLHATAKVEGDAYAVCFDFKSHLLPKLLSLFPPSTADGLRARLERHPVFVAVDADAYPTVTVKARLGAMLENDREHYIPLEVTDFC